MNWKFRHLFYDEGEMFAPPVEEIHIRIGTGGGGPPGDSRETDTLGYRGVEPMITVLGVL